MKIGALISGIVARLHKANEEFVRQQNNGYLLPDDCLTLGVRLKTAADALDIATITGALSFKVVQRFGDEVEAVCEFLEWNNKMNKEVNRFIRQVVEVTSSGEVTWDESEALMNELSNLTSLKDMQRCFHRWQHNQAQKRLTEFVAKIAAKPSSETSSAPTNAAPEHVQSDSRLKRREAAASEVVSPEARKLYEQGLAAHSRAEKIRLFGLAIDAEHKYAKKATGKTAQKAMQASQ